MTCHKKLSKKARLSGGVNYKFFNRLPVAPGLGQRGGFRRVNPAIVQMFRKDNLAFMGSARRNQNSVLRSTPGA
jgi:hypothetical protein